MLQLIALPMLLSSFDHYRPTYIKSNVLAVLLGVLAVKADVFFRKSGTVL
ncbi:hypothetical protein APHWI1_0173 [Anaplasma phagocytophilum str. ApWI1]|uniref:Uncharacterized protein n=2 Tax=Anaplasma phagocytophilum TaxID=948 RepID=Q2GK37_ANAPZ|nr:hypothetical protein APH_0682 [Anaplasma phagocytophilum str. HZ]AGR79427.1 hypothetical protein YYU_03230 [Anaplasma phagocytophilum str. HZ2]AGR80675.1 hypothetical protein WSQ_03225 [Anaplasma phagocytophilum str. JM]KJV59951.1 hypothetical protein APHWEB_1342 [Anaplasma phagocytophilum str. Webster]KJV82377.1 hypothetical protein APHHGE2_0971 [Anaplasma phagocytophilum str. HGE2]KJV85109.1 hypothetical protein APHWI1_0173 [Anaplasma phagocytophilum str. ApWI1]KJV87394.1 hypothetical pr